MQEDTIHALRSEKFSPNNLKELQALYPHCKIKIYHSVFHLLTNYLIYYFLRSKKFVIARRTSAGKNNNKFNLLKWVLYIISYEINFLDYYLDLRALSNLNLRHDIIVRSNICSKKMLEKFEFNNVRFLKNFHVLDVTKPQEKCFSKILYISQATPNILKDHYWDQQSLWSIENQKFIYCVLGHLAEYGHSVFVKLRGHEGEEALMAEGAYYKALNQKFTLVKSEDQFCNLMKHDDVLVLSSHSTLALDLFYNGNNCIFLHNKKYHGMDLQAFGCYVLEGVSEVEAFHHVRSYLRGD